MEMHKRGLWRNLVWKTSMGKEHKQRLQNSPVCYGHTHRGSTSPDIPPQRTSTLHPCMLQISYKEFAQLLSLISTKAWKRLLKACFVICALHSLVAQPAYLFLSSFNSSNWYENSIYLFIFSKGGAGLVRHREEIKKADITVNRLYVFERLQGETN